MDFFKQIQAPTLHEAEVVEIRSIRKGAANPWMKGVPLTKETRQKISEGNLGKKLTEEHKRKLSEACQGRKFTEEHKRKLSEACQGRATSVEHKRNLATYKYLGRPMAEWAKELGYRRSTLATYFKKHDNIDRYIANPFGKIEIVNHNSKAVHTPLGQFNTLADACEAHGRSRNHTVFVSSKCEQYKYPEWYYIAKKG